MKLKIVILLLCFTWIPKGHTVIDPRAKTIGTLAVYGTVGGALLGTASMAYGTSIRSIFQGASLGLYAGLIFGSYVVFSHTMAESDAKGETYPDDAETPYEEEIEEERGIFDDMFGQRWNPYQLQKELFKQKKIKADYYITFVDFRF